MLSHLFLKEKESFSKCLKNHHGQKLASFMAGNIDNLKLPLRRYTGNELITLNKDKQDPIVEGILFPNDYVLLVSEPKVGKSILALQLAASISSGTPFLDTFKVSKAYKVWYFATEGKDEDIKKRLIEMKKMVPFNLDNFVLFCSAGFRLNTSIGKNGVQQLLGLYKDELPKVIIIDALYLAIQGTLKDDGVVNEFNYIIRQFAEKCDAALIIVHHTKKPTIMDGKLYSPENKMGEIFGSIFLPAGADHIFHMGYNKKTNLHSLLCQSQRSGEIAEFITMKMEEPTPLGFIHVTEEKSGGNPLKGFLQACSQGLTIKELMKKTNSSRASIYRWIEEEKNEIEQVSHYPAIYRLRNETVQNEK